MPANLTPDYLAAEKRYKESRDPAEKLEHLQDMLRLIPKHKGTDHLQGDIKRKISQLKASLETKSGVKRGPDYSIPKEGAGQVILVGPPNAGKSSLVAALTNANPEIAPYPFTTAKPGPAMMAFEDAAVQLIDAPAVCVEFHQTWMNGLIRNADLVLVVLDAASDSVVDAYLELRDVLEQQRIRLDPDPNEQRMSDGRAWKRTRYAANKIDLPGARENLRVFRELLAEPPELIEIDAVSRNGVEELRRALWEALRVIRVYTKTPGKQPQMFNPIILPVGATVLEFARTIHKDFAQQLDYARVWGDAKYDGMRVPRDHVLSDHDVVELHI